jgi:hypothetical protein
MSMTKETLTLKSKSTRDSTATSTLAEPPTTVTAGKEPNKGNAKPPSAVTRLLEFAIINSVYVFIQLRQGVGYRGLPTKLDKGWLTLEDADILGTKQYMHVGQLLMQVRDGSYIAHIHTTEGRGPSKSFEAALGELK